jgi:hypothetical protein
MPWGTEAVVAAIVAIYCQLPMTHMLATVFASSSDHHELSKATVVDARTAEGRAGSGNVDRAIGGVSA